MSNENVKSYRVTIKGRQTRAYNTQAINGK